MAAGILAGRLWTFRCLLDVGSSDLQLSLGIWPEVYEQRLSGIERIPLEPEQCTKPA